MSNDGVNTVGFAAGGDFLAVNCSWYYLFTGEVSEADARFNTDFRWMTNPSSPTCPSDVAYDIEAVMTHERGNTFGLAHVSDATSPHMTMSTNINGPCQAQERSIGLGDFLGISTKH